MADQETVDLVVLGPFAGIDTRSAGPYADPKSLTIASNSSTQYKTGALATAYGREAFLEFSNVAANLNSVVTYTISQGHILYIVQDTAGNIVYWDSVSQEFGTLGNAELFTQAIQSNGILWLNNGQQIFQAPGPAGPSLALWQYPEPSTNTYNYNASAGPIGQGVLAKGIYSYAFVQKIALENVNTIAYQYTTPNGAVATGTRNNGSAIFPFHVDNSGDRPDQLTGLFAGNTVDGYPYTTQVFRYSTNSPTWFFLTEIKTNEIYIDSASDASISGNQQLILNQDPPPTGIGFPVNPIASHQDRMWTMAIVNDADTNKIPQTQIQYSEVGEPWSFDKLDNVLLIEDEETTLKTGNLGPTGVPFGDIPTGLMPLGSSLMGFRRGTTSMVYGVDESTYQALKIFADLGLIAPLSLIRYNGLDWWLSAQGFYGFDGSNVNWISGPIYNILQSFGPAALQQCVGFPKDLACHWSFPTENITLKYYIPNQTWETLPYATPFATANTTIASDLTTAPLSIGQVVAVRPNSTLIDFWFAAIDDLGEPVSATVKSQEVDSGGPQWQKTYGKVMVYAPLQPGVTAEVYLYVNEQLAQEWTLANGMAFNLGVGRPIKVQNVTKSNAQGDLAQLQVVLNNAPGATQPAVLYGARVGGEMKRAWIIQTVDTAPPDGALPYG